MIAVNFNLNIEGGGEATLANGDDLSEGMLNDIGVGAYRGQRAPLVESVFEYGSRRGAWRVLDVFRRIRDQDEHPWGRSRAGTKSRIGQGVR